MSEEPTRPAQDLDLEELDAALSEHDVEASEGRGRRRRPVADWGGDDLFNHVPRRRFTRPGAGAHVRRPGATSATSHQLRRSAEPSSNAPQRHSDSDGHEDGPVSMLAAAHSAVERPIITVYEDSPTAGAAAPVERVRRRPRRTVDQRLGPRPDRIAAWAFGLGVLLILLAVATADAATRAGF
jgi:hypothetical protein